MKPLRYCCCGCSLQAGTIIIAAMELVPLIVLFCLDAKLIAVTNIELNPKILTAFSDPVKVLDDINRASDHPELIIINQILKVIICIISMSIIRVGLLILGSCKEKLWMMVPWIGTQATGLIAAPIFFIYIVSEFSFFSTFCATVSITIVVFFAINLYYFMVVLSHFEEIRLKQAQTDLKFDDMANPLIYEANTTSSIYS